MGATMQLFRKGEGGQDRAKRCHLTAVNHSISGGGGGVLSPFGPFHQWGGGGGGVLSPFGGSISGGRVLSPFGGSISRGWGGGVLIQPVEGGGGGAVPFKSIQSVGGGGVLSPLSLFNQSGGGCCPL